MTMRREFADRADLIAYVAAQFPEAVAVDDAISPIRGGRGAAEAILAQVDPAEYARTRNRLDGAVTGLSPYIRHGVLGLAEVRDRVRVLAKGPKDAAKLINELGWRDYFQRVYAQISATEGDDIWQDREPSSAGLAPDAYAADLPGEIPAGETGLACIDGWSRELRETGYLHNHARMYVAAYVVHWRRVRWQAGARWFLTHLLDGDPASNNLSWQWVAGTFSHKPYIFNRENLERNTGGVFCRRCPLRGKCDFEGSYEALAERLF